MNKNNPEKTTHFGYQPVSSAEKTEKVAGVFHSVADQYDIMNDLMSLGLHRLWKRFAVEMSGVKLGNTVLDLAGGTGDLAKRFSPLVGSQGKVVIADINNAMLKKGRARLIDDGIVDNIAYVQADAEALPFSDNYFNCVIIGFGLRNVTHKEEALASMYRVLKHAGRALVLEFSTPTSKILRSVYDAYSFSILPWLGKTIVNDANSYRYLAESIRMHPDQEILKSMMQQAGFENCDFYNLSGGIVALHRGYKC